MERASHDLRAVITTYEGKHNHDVPAARGSGGYNNMTRPAPPSTNTIRPSPIISNHPNLTNSTRLQTPYTLEMLQDTNSFAFAGYGNSSGPYTDNSLAIAKEEPRDDPFFDSFMN